ncbi:SlyX family protein [Curvibacter sp. CHRR-16]|uniref:SlyX family protein n=1 Tax=Curvibacter sp. CHRR-16 TaxID=2835872 RepID=UPI001BDB366D|nr:SlyX family protein [Curvibacter sp. CHRR-16]MBT0569260.1 SlyX family protein [Curvibacter sp. CHRR-16]
MSTSTEHTHTPATALQTLEERLTDLEIKAAYSEHTIDQLDSIVARQQEQIDWLTREVAMLRGRLHETLSEPQSVRNLHEERPPHY